MVLHVLQQLLSLFLGFPITCLLIFVFSIFLVIRVYITLQRSSRRDDITVGFFHPYCHAGGGGERVLWCAIRALATLQEKSKVLKKIRILIYTGDVLSQTDASSYAAIKDRVVARFNIPESHLPWCQVEFVPLRSRILLADKTYKRLTLIGQSLGSMIVGLEALLRGPCDVYVDTTGFAFTLWIAKVVAGCKTAAYVHYPTISTDMIDAIDTASFNNNAAIASSPTRKRLKRWYYKLFAILYGIFGGNSCDVVMVNSSWTKRHIEVLWKHRNVVRVYPPCDTSAMIETTAQNVRNKWILSIGQFRPEKNHPLQLRAFAGLLKKLRNTDDVRLVIVGSCRGLDDERRVQDLLELSKNLKIESQVDIVPNAPYKKLLELFRTASVGLHTMKDEHFGIGVVEMMASGLVTIAHNSAGPKEDIITETRGRTGYLARTEEEFTDCMMQALTLSNDEKSELRKRAIESSHRFSDSVFDKSFIAAMKQLLISAAEEKKQ